MPLSITLRYIHGGLNLARIGNYSISDNTAEQNKI